MFKLPALLVVPLASRAFVFAKTPNAPLLVGRVAANQNRIAFNYAGKIWAVNPAGEAVPTFRKEFVTLFDSDAYSTRRNNN